MVDVEYGRRVAVCAKCGRSYPAVYAGCPRCSERDDSSWTVVEAVIVLLVVLVALFALSRLRGVSAALSSYL